MTEASLACDGVANQCARLGRLPFRDCPWLPTHLQLQINLCIFFLEFLEGNSECITARIGENSSDGLLCFAIRTSPFAASQSTCSGKWKVGACMPVVPLSWRLFSSAELISLRYACSGVTAGHPSHCLSSACFVSGWGCTWARGMLMT